MEVTYRGWMVISESWAWVESFEYTTGIRPGSKFDQSRDEPFLPGAKIDWSGKFAGLVVGIFCLGFIDFNNSFNLTTVEGLPIFNLKL